MRTRRSALRNGPDGQSRLEPRARPGRRGCKRRSSFTRTVGRLRKAGRAGGACWRDPTSPLVSILLKSRTRALAQGRKPPVHVPESPAGKISVCSPASTDGLGASGCRRDPRKHSEAWNRGSHPLPLPGGRADTSSLTGVSARGYGAPSGPHPVPTPPGTRGPAPGGSRRARPPRRERSRWDLSSAPPISGGAQSWPGPGLPRRSSRGPGRTGARRKEPPPPLPPPLPRRAQPGTHPRETAVAGGEGPGESSPCLPAGPSCFGIFSSLPRKLYSIFVTTIIFIFLGYPWMV